jgi:hypothetical protein
LPLRVAFSTLRVRRDDPAEKYLVAMLLNMAGEDEKVQRPVVYPVFGRGRILAVLAGKGITAEAIQEVGEFLCNGCTCNIKGQLPGADLLMAVDWQGRLEAFDKSQDQDQEPGPEPGAKGTAAVAAAQAPGPNRKDLGSTAAAAAVAAELKAGKTAEIQPAALPEPNDPPAANAGGRSLVSLAILATLLGGLLLVAVGSFCIRCLRSNRTPVT